MANEQTKGWRPIHDNHAIDVMAVVVTFSQPIPDLLLKRVLRASEDVAFGAGLKSRHGVNSLPITIGPNGVSASQAGAAQGQMFNSLFETAEGVQLPTQLAEQLVVQQTAVIYRTWRYVSWQWQRERFRMLMSPALKGVASSVGTASIRLEYLDRFQFDGDAAEAAAHGLLMSKSELIAPYVFSAPGLWHSHTGAFVKSDNRSKRLQQVMIDAIEEPYPPQSRTQPVRWVNITTSLEDRFEQQADVDEENDPASIFLTLDSMHTSLKDVLAAVITDSMVERIYLRGK
jgi:uncharacterized protein (TIGR04255 family)